MMQTLPLQSSPMDTGRGMRPDLPRTRPVCNRISASGAHLGDTTNNLGDLRHSQRSLNELKTIVL